MSGEQFALPDAVDRLREIRRTPPDNRVIVISAADPLNLAGIITSGDRIRAVAGTSVAYQNGVPVPIETSSDSAVTTRGVRNAAVSGPIGAEIV